MFSPIQKSKSAPGMPSLYIVTQTLKLSAEHHFSHALNI